MGRVGDVLVVWVVLQSALDVLGGFAVVIRLVFVVLVGLTVALIVFTPLKYYIPGYDDLKVGREYRQMKYRVDSLETQVNYQSKYIENIKNVLNGGEAKVLDTTELKVPKDELSDD